MSVNKAIIIGRLGQDPELKHTPTGVAVANFSVATTEKYKDQEKTEWHRIVVFNKVAELCSQYLNKGSQVFIEGKIQTRSWEKDGEKRYSTEIVANTVQFLDKKESKEQTSQSGFATDDIPF